MGQNQRLDVKALVSWERVKDNAHISGLENWVVIIGGEAGLKRKMTVSLLSKI